MLPVAVSETSTLSSHTGSWKYVQPVYHDRIAPCNAGCPVGIDIQGYMSLLRERRLEEARDLLMRENPMPAVTGRVCHHPCETVCNRLLFDGAVSIHAVERMLGDLPLGESDGEPRSPRSQVVAVVGSGPAGLACAYHLARLGYGVTVYEAAAEPGGMLRLGIPEYRLPRSVLNHDIDRIVAQGVVIQCHVRVGEDIPWWSMLTRFDAVFVATGAHCGRPLGVQGEEGPGVRAGLEFLREVNGGGRPDLGQHVVVVGGGNTAIDCARTAIRLGAKVTILYRRTRKEMPAIDEEIEEAEREGVRFAFLAAPVAFDRELGRLRAIECERMSLGEPDESGRRRPVPTGERFSLPADTMLTAIGEAADLSTLPTEIERTDWAVAVTETGSTSRARVFAGGDLTDEPRTVAHALGAGKRAAVGIDQHLRLAAGESLDDGDLSRLRYGGSGNLSMTWWRMDDPVERVAPVNEVVEFDQLNVNHFVAVPRNPDERLPVAESHPGFAEVNRGLPCNVALKEADRCFSCGVCNRCELCLIFCPDLAISRRDNGGRYVIALEYCKGCGVCVAECPRGAMVMTREGL
jgi:NADPH-dependent glutamate synthase beta subunit-like oxidoreductase